MLDRYALAAVLGFSLGILSHSLVSSWFFALFLFVIAGALILTHLLLHRAAYLLVAVLFLATALGSARALLTPSALPENFTPLIHQEVTIEGTVSAPPDVRETHQRVILTATYKGETTNLLVVTDRYPKTSFGERLIAKGTLEYPKPFETDTGRVFAYDQFLQKDGVFAVLSFATINVVEERHGFAHVLGTISDIKPTFIAGLERALSEPYAALSGGLVAGGKEGLGEALVDAFIATGLIHIVVLSGYNVMIVAEAVLRILSALLANLKRREVIGAIAAGGTILLFVLAAGAGAASVRAGLMALVALFARATGRTYDGVRALLFVGVIMLLQNPLVLLHDPGFQLSFVATLGLILGAPIVERFLTFVSLRWFREIVSATIAAQIAVLPLLLYQTGLLSLVALPANIVVLPVVPFAMAASLLAGVAGLLVPPLAVVFGLPALLSVGFIVIVAEWLGALPLAAISVPSFSFVFVLLAYTLLGFFVWKFTQAQKGAAFRPRSS